MSHYIVEHRYRGNYVMETITGVEDLDTTRYENITKYFYIMIL